MRLNDYKKSAAKIKRISGGFKPEVLLILGSGLGKTAELISSPQIIPYARIPGFRTSTAPGHAGRLIMGTLGGRRVAAMQGRMHFYEGYSYEEVAFPVRVFKLLGVKTMVITNAAGGVNKGFRCGDLMMITDHISFNLKSPLTGPNITEFGPRFPDMTYAYSPELRESAEKTALRCGIELQKGVYYYTTGPQYETPAEIAAVRSLGGDAVGMSTVPEVITANQCGIKTLAFSLISNMAAGMLDKPLTESEVLETAAASSQSFTNLIVGVIEDME